MKIQIKKIFSDKIIIEGEAYSFKEFIEAHRTDLSGANLYRANLSEADLSEADLSGADLSGANLYGANLYGAKIKINQKDDIIKALKINIIE